MKSVKLAIVVPCLNEQFCLEHNIQTLISILENLEKKTLINKDSFLLFVDDGSTDETWQVILNAKEKFSSRIKGVKFTRNFGNQSAILAGLNTANKKNVDCVITIDADLQQDENKIEEFILKFLEGNEIVCGIRNNRKTDNIFKKISSLMFYKLVNLLGCKMIPNHSEFRLMSKRALDMLSLYRERNLFLRGIFPEFGLKTAYVYFDVKKRNYGHSKFNFISLFRLASWGITSFSVRPLRLIFYIGFFIAMTSFFIGILSAYQLYFVHQKPFLLNSLNFFEIFSTFISGLQILCIGIIGEYIGQILQEIKSRPQYHIDCEFD